MTPILPSSGLDPHLRSVFRGAVVDTGFGVDGPVEVAKEGPRDARALRRSSAFLMEKAIRCEILLASLSLVPAGTRERC